VKDIEINMTDIQNISLNNQFGKFHEYKMKFSRWGSNKICHKNSAVAIVLKVNLEKTIEKLKDRIIH